MAGANLAGRRLGSCILTWQHGEQRRSAGVVVREESKTRDKAMTGVKQCYDNAMTCYGHSDMKAVEKMLLTGHEWLQQ